MSNIFYDGRNFLRRPNSDGKCLLENYVEERAVAELELSNEEQTVQAIKDGHKGILTVHLDANTHDLTQHLDAYRPPDGPSARSKGLRREMKERLLFEQALKEVEEDLNKPFVDEYISTKQQDYDQPDFESRKPAPTADRDYTREQPVTFWSEHRNKIHSVTQVRPTFDTPFRKNTTFSKPISERWDPDQVMPYERDHVPNM